MKEKITAYILSMVMIFSVILSSCDQTIGGKTTDTQQVTKEPEMNVDYTLPLSSVRPDLSFFSDTEDTGVMIATDAMYTFRALEMPPDSSILGESANVDENGTICVVGSMSTTSSYDRFHRYRKDGVFLETVSYRKPICDTGEIAKTPMILADNTLVYHTMVYQNFGAPEGAMADLILASADGEILARTELPALYADECRVLPDGRIAVSAGGMVLLYDRELALLCEIPTQANALLYAPTGELYAQAGWGGQYSLLNTETRTSTPMTAYDASNLDDTLPMYFSETASAYDAYFSDETGLWGVESGNDEAQLLCDWLQSGQSYSKLMIQTIFDEETLFVGIQDPFTAKTVYGLLYRNPDAAEAMPGKRYITVGLLGVDASVEIHIMDAVARFNAESSDYFVSVMTYQVKRNATDTSTMKSEEFEAALMNDTAADIIVSGEEMRALILGYAEKSAFVDLADSFEATLLPCAADAYRTTQGALYTIPLHMRLSLFAAKDYMFGYDEVLSIDGMLRLSEMAKQEGLSLFNEVTPQDLLSVATPSFADRLTGECRYDSDAFADVIRFSEEAKDLRSPDEDDLVYAYGDYIVEDSAYAEKWQNDEFLLTRFPFYSIYAYPMMKLFTGRRDFAMHGYPTDGGETVLLSCDADISITSDSASVRGAAEFAAFLLSDEVQTYDRIHGLPVTASGLEIVLEQDTYYYSHGLYEDDGNGNFYVSSLYMMDEETIAKFFSDAITVTITNDDRAAIRRFLMTAEAQSLTDATMNAILEEELSAYRAGIRSLEETQNILQSRLWIYINE